MFAIGCSRSFEFESALGTDARHEDSTDFGGSDAQVSAV